jgi:hypothetical protein
VASGYRYCACRDCTEIIVGEEGAFCALCKEAGCPDYQGQEGMSQECQRTDVGAEDFYMNDGMTSGPMERN